MSDLGIAPGSGRKGFDRLFHALLHSWDGLRAALRTEEAFRLEVILACLLIPLSLSFDIGPVRHVVLIFAVVQVMIVELLNTGIERVVDRISFERHELSKEAKDIGSAAVFLSLLFAGFTWIFLLFSGPV